MSSDEKQKSKQTMAKAVGLLATVAILIVSYTLAGLFIAYLINTYVEPNIPALLVDVVFALLGFSLGLFNVLRFAQRSEAQKS